MSKYTNYLNDDIDTTSPLVDGEKVIWEGKPKKFAFVLNNVITMFPFALIWLLFDGFFIYMIISNGEATKPMWPFFIPFFAIHLMPVWMWIINILTVNRKWKKAKYYLTDKRIIIQNGIITENYQTIYYKDITNVSLHVGIIDKLLGVGDINFSVTDRALNGMEVFFDLKDYKEIYKKIQKVVLDIQTDIEYPNAYRPDSNPGYNTNYDPKN